MAGSKMEVPLPPAVEAMIQQICADRYLPPPDMIAREKLLSLGEQATMDILRKISASKNEVRNLNGFIIFMAKKYCSSPTQDSISVSSLRQTLPSPTHFSPTPSYRSSYSQADYGTQSPSRSSLVYSPSSSSGLSSMPERTEHLLALNKLEFRKAFLILSYIGSKSIEDVMYADDIMRLKDLKMVSFEKKVWDSYGSKCCDEADRLKYLDWDEGKTYQYQCHVYPNGHYRFKGPYLSTTRTHLQRQLGDENVLLVKFAEEDTDSKKLSLDSLHCNAVFNKIAEEGILVGLRRYKFFVFKDGGKEEKTKKPTSSSVKCYFVQIVSIFPCANREANNLFKRTVHDARCLFMHVHMVSNMAKYMARFSLILSKTIKLHVDLSSVHIERIEDIPCRDENGCVVYNKDGEALIHTDGTGYISEDLALTCPKDFYKAKYISDGSFEKFRGHLNLEDKSLELGGPIACIKEPPSLMQIRLFNNGCAVKGTLLVNRMLPARTIQIRNSMIKVETDPKLSGAPTWNSLELVGISNQPRKNYLSRNLIALLSYGGVPNEFFMDILTNAWENAQSVYSNKRAALKVALNYGEIDDDFTVARMILAGFPLNEPYLQQRLSVFAADEMKGLKGGRLPISESFYLMGTADPTGVLNRDEVCVVLDKGQISGDVLVYRNPGLHFGDPHRLKAVYVKALDDIIGNAKYAIFFSIKGHRSVGSEIANGDFDGDMYWVSRHPELLMSFKASKPWQRIYSSPDVQSIKPSEFSAYELEHQLFQLFLSTRFRKNYSMSVASDSWLAFMDRILTLGESRSNEKDRIREKMVQLVDIYYDALDAPKSGKKVIVPNELKASTYPHYMGKTQSYNSNSILGLIYDTVSSLKVKDHKVEEIWKLPCFDIEVPEACYLLWKERYDNYRYDMVEAMKSNDESKNDAANSVIKKYKHMLYGAPAFEESPRRVEEIYNEALAIYDITYNFAIYKQHVKYCGFAWKVAGPALLKLYMQKQSQKTFLCSQSVLSEVL